jgi:hypothetical protein
MSPVGRPQNNGPVAALDAATALIADVVVRQRIEGTPPPVVEAVTWAITQHLAVLGELAEVLQHQLADDEAAGGLHPRPDEREFTVRLSDTAAALQAALSSAQLFTAELANQLSQAPLRHTA